MKKFNNVKDFNKYLENEFDFGFEEEEIEDVEKFVDGKNYEILDCIGDDLDVEDNVIIVDEKWFWIVENCMGIGFVELDECEIEYIKDNM